MTGPVRGSLSDSATVVRAVSVIMGTVVGLTFLFGFGNVLSLALRLGVPGWVAPLVAPAVDLSILGLLLGIRHRALTGQRSHAGTERGGTARCRRIRESGVRRRWSAPPDRLVGDRGRSVAGDRGSESGSRSSSRRRTSGRRRTGTGEVGQLDESPVRACRAGDGRPVMAVRSLEALLDCARQEDAVHRATYQRPISADTFRVRFRIGAVRARQLVRIVRAENETDIPVPV